MTEAYPIRALYKSHNLKSILPGCVFLPLDEAIASRRVFVIVSGSNGRVGGNALEPDK